MRRILALTVLVALAAAAAAPAHAQMVSKKFRFKAGVPLEVGEDVGGGVRLDSITFTLPAAGEKGSFLHRTAGQAQAVVAISNLSKESRKVGVAVALLDDQGNLLGVASGGSVMKGIAALRQVGYSLVFDFVNGRIPEATAFQISVEIKP